ncbi:very short patch repair endonuclease [Candidatus Woesearchaeota archaeon]|nr:very short patch repair endonuclease [Candidatus Woesearchaeota archaeon]
MADIFSKKTRSKIMSCIRGKDTKPEILLRKALFKKGYRYSLNHRFKELNFKPDIVMVSRKVCIFIDGCFWHGCERCYRPPKSNKKYWIPKIKRNMQRDKEQNTYLKKKRWKVIRIWEHEINKNMEKALNKIIKK